MKRVTLMGLPIDPIRYEDFVSIMEREIQRGPGRVIQPLNVDTLNQTARDRWLFDWIRGADVVYADGAGITFGVRVMGHKIPQRLTAADLIFDLALAWSDGRHSIYLLGGPPGLSEAAAQALKIRYPGFRVVGTFRGHLNQQEDQEAIADIRAKKPDVLCVGFGTPVQERWIERYRFQLPDVPVFWPVGAMSTYVAGTVPRAPEWMRSYGLEWAFRFGLEPRRLFRRYIIGNPVFAMRLLRERWFGGMATPPTDPMD
ncbi:MAG: WecB/TagA/CpsF family glycosyltransferase [Myxococcales bacterium]|nr:WecB/TagA/CpsF family glycosyltransferase [Myxococcales bacterium]